MCSLYESKHFVLIYSANKHSILERSPFAIRTASLLLVLFFSMISSQATSVRPRRHARSGLYEVARKRSVVAYKPDLWLQL